MKWGYFVNVLLGIVCCAQVRAMQVRANSRKRRRDVWDSGLTCALHSHLPQVLTYKILTKEESPGFKPGLSYIGLLL